MKYICLLFIVITLAIVVGFRLDFISEKNFLMVLPVITGIGGLLIGAWLTTRQQEIQRQYDFKKTQLSSFYSPLVGIRQEIRTLSELREKVTDSSEKKWKDVSEKYRAEGKNEAVTEERDDYSQRFERLIEYNNRQLEERLLPLYQRMLDIFRDNLWLAEDETKEHYGTLIKFVDIWNRWLDRSISHDTSKELDHSEKALFPFYEHLEQKHGELRTELKEGKN